MASSTDGPNNYLYLHKVRCFAAVSTQLYFDISIIAILLSNCAVITWRQALIEFNLKLI